MSHTRALGTCYYPEHWPEEIWEQDAARMVAAGISWVRIGEFAWSRLEAVPGKLTWDWLDRAVDTLGAAGLKVIMGTPTATPPRWMLDRHPDMLAVDAEGRPRGFGSRRHYCFSHAGYRAEAVRITRLMGARYGRNPHVQAWQTDNEYGCHDTVISYSPAARAAFRNWLAQRYQSPDALNRAWATVFWSRDYDSFDAVDLPNLTVTEPAPAHVMDFRRFCSDQVVAFNRAKVDVLRTLTDAPLLHNYMGRILEFDHFAMGADLDIATWDSYPIGFLSDRIDAPAEHKRTYLRQGDPDFQAFHHDLYRAVARRAPAGADAPRWWVMEQQPGPVNWAPYNPAPLPGMARLWAHEAYAHGAEVVAYFRWRQAPFAQEQMHAGLLRPDSSPAPGLAECTQVASELAMMGPADAGRSPVAIVYDYPSQWAWETQPQGADFDWFALVFDLYRGLRTLGQSVDFVAPDADLSSYALVLCPGTFNIGETLTTQLASRTGPVLLGPRTGTRTETFEIPLPLPPKVPGLETTIALTESLPPDAPMPLQEGGAMIRWFEHLEGPADTLEATESGQPALVCSGNLHYLAGWPDTEALSRILRRLLDTAGLDSLPMPDGLRLRETPTHKVWINYSQQSHEIDGITVPPIDAVWQSKS